MRRDCGGLVVAALLSVATLGGCSSTAGAGAQHPAAAPPVVDRNTTSALLLSSYLEMLQRLVQGGLAEQAEILSSTRRDYEVAQTPSHQLRYALVLATPGHAGTDVERAQLLLRGLTALPESLLPSERALAVLELQQVDRMLALSSENQRLQASAERTDREHVTALNKRLQTEIDENAQLRKDLDEAHAKLDAITNIERSLNKRKPGTEGSAP
jgi:YfhG lipoprotein